MIELGRQVKDKITGFSGTATGFCTYISGCSQVLISAKITDGGDAKTLWVDEQRVDYVGRDKIILDNSQTPGCDIPAPVR